MTYIHERTVADDITGESHVVWRGFRFELRNEIGQLVWSAEVEASDGDDPLAVLRKLDERQAWVPNPVQYTDVSGKPVFVKKRNPELDADGNVKRDDEGREIASHVVTDEPVIVDEGSFQPAGEPFRDWQGTAPNFTATRGWNEQYGEYRDYPTPVTATLLEAE